MHEGGAGMIRFGPAGWSYKDWAGIVYPSPAPKGFDPLEYIAGYFDTIEVNSTFYRPARKEVAEDPRTRDTYVVTNNHYRGKGITNALMLRSMVQGGKVPAPPALFADYGEVLEGFAEPAPPPLRL
jgi:uncharacterized protein YecE (DUF72 family)